MLTVSDRFLATLRVPHAIAVRATIEQPGKAPVAVPVAGGRINLDATAAVRRTGTLTIPWTLDPDVEASLGLDLRTLPFGSYAYLERGLRYGDGTSELVPLGRLRIDAVSWRTSEGTASLELSDRMAQLAEMTFNPPHAPAGKKPSNACVDLAKVAFGDTITYHVLTDVAAEPTLADVTYSGYFAKAIADLAASVGAEAYFDAVGDFVVRPLPSTAAAPPSVWTIDSGETGVLIDADESLDRSETVNGVLVKGQPDAGSPPVEVYATDDDPTSPTFYGGPFGRVVLIFESQAVQTAAQATATAQAMLEQRLGLGRSLVIDAVPNPALEPGDTVTVRFPDGRQEPHYIDGLRVPLDAVSGVELAASSLYRPGEPRIPPPARRLRFESGAQAWRELADARLVQA